MEKYEKIRVVGRGGYGMVYLCREVATKKLVIVKQIPVEQMSKEERQASLNEAKVLAMLDHPNIIAYYDNFLENKSIVIVMEYAPGGTLFDCLQQRGNSLLPGEDVISYFTQIVLALHHVHSKQILHRDLKTQNLLLNEQKNVVKVGDFGISKILSSKSKAFSVVGTPCYISPELCEGKPYNQKSDIWALGCVLYELLTLKRPFEANNLPALVMKIMQGTFAPIAEHYSPELRQLVLSLLHLDPSRRPSLTQLMCQPIIMAVQYRLYMNIGALPCSSLHTRNERSSQVSLYTPSGNQSPLENDGKDIGSSVYLLEGESRTPCILPGPPKMCVTRVSLGGIHKMGVTQTGQTFFWKEDEKEGNAQFIPVVFEEKGSFRVIKVVSGFNFTLLLTDKGIVLSFGVGTSGCLGHGDYKDVTQPKIIEALLGHDVMSISCGVSHAIAITRGHLVFSWGNSENGKLGLGSTGSVNAPQKVPLPESFVPSAAFCGVDSSCLLSCLGHVLVCGSNRCNKLSLNTDHEVSEMWEFVQPKNPGLDGKIIKFLASGKNQTTFITDNGSVYTIGSSSFAHDLEMKQAHKVPLLKPCERVICAKSFTVAVADGHMYKWSTLDSVSLIDLPSKVIFFDCYDDNMMAVCIP